MGRGEQFNTEEAAGDLAREGNLLFPAPGSEAERKWARDNFATPYQGASIADHIQETRDV